MDRTIEQMGEDLARAGYAESTRERYLEVAVKLSRHFGKPIAQLPESSCANSSTC